MDTAKPNVIVRRTRAADAEAFARLFSDEAVFGGVLQMPYPSAEIWRKRLEEHEVPGKPGLPLTAEVQGEVVGNAGLFMAAPALRRQHAMGLGICVAKEWQGRGVGTALMTALTDYADRWANVLRIELTVYTDNTRAIGLYRRHGFVTEGTHIGFAMRGGVFVDALSMARLHPNPPRIGAG